jgi:hypothetical protein
MSRNKIIVSEVIVVINATISHRNVNALYASDNIGTVISC